MKDASDPTAGEVREFESKDSDRHNPHGETDDAKHALLSRPPFSLRLQLLLGFLTAFLFALAVAGIIIKDTYELETKIRGLEIVNDYVLEIDQARRFEKNYFLYNTNLRDALESVYNARVILDGSQDELRSIIGDKKLSKILENLNAYEALLTSLPASAAELGGEMADGQKEAIEKRVRKQGQTMISLAQELMKREKKD